MSLELPCFHGEHKADFWRYAGQYMGVSENKGYLILGVLINKDPTIWGTI